MKKLGNIIAALVFTCAGVIFWSIGASALSYPDTIMVNGVNLEEHAAEYPKIQYESNGTNGTLTLDGVSLKRLSVQMGSGRKLNLILKGENTIERDSSSPSSASIININTNEGELSITGEGSLILKDGNIVATPTMAITNTGATAGKFIIKGGTITSETGSFSVTNNDFILNSGNLSLSMIILDTKGLTVESGKMTINTAHLLNGASILINGGDVTFDESAGNINGVGLSIVNNGNLTVNNGSVSIKGAVLAVGFSKEASLKLGDGMYIVEDGVELKETPKAETPLAKFDKTFLNASGEVAKTVTIKKIGDSEAENSKTSDHTIYYMVAIVVFAGILILKSRRTARI